MRTDLHLECSPLLSEAQTDSLQSPTQTPVKTYYCSLTWHKQEAQIYMFHRLYGKVDLRSTLIEFIPYTPCSICQWGVRTRLRSAPPELGTDASGCPRWSACADVEERTSVNIIHHQLFVFKHLMWSIIHFLNAWNRPTVLTTQHALPRSAILMHILSAFWGSRGFTKKSAAEWAVWGGTQTILTLKWNFQQHIYSQSEDIWHLI